LIVSGEFDDGGEFTYWLRWDGTNWVAMPNMVDGAGYSIAYDSAEAEYQVGGDFTEDAAGAFLGNGYARWDGTDQWRPGSVDVPGETVSGDPIVRAILLDSDRIYLGLTSYGTAYARATAEVTYNGTAPGYPVFKITRTGGAGGTLTEIANLTSGVKLAFNYALADGETITVDLRRDQFGIESNLYGRRLSALDPESAVALSQFYLLPGETNELSVYVVDDTGNIGVALEVYEEHWSVDGVA
jgi:hypothetical protein